MTADPGSSLDPDAAELVAQVRALAMPSLSDRGVEGARAYYESGLAREAAPLPIHYVEEVTVPVQGGTIQARVYRPGPGGPRPLVVYTHGGGWVIGSLDTSDAFCRRLAKCADCTVVSVGYRLAPEHPFPVPVEDAEAALRWSHDHAAEIGADPSKLIVLGDSAGANLAAVVTRRTRDSGGPRIARQILAYPVTDHRLDRPSHLRFGTSWPLTTEELAWFWDLYIANPEERLHPDASPLRADVSNLPRATLIVGGSDPLRDDGLAYANHLVAAGVPLDLHLYEGQIHGFATFDPSILPTSREALSIIASAIQTA
jgi:acetyl esterase